jgi:hypothetical protein
MCNVFEVTIGLTHMGNSMILRLFCVDMVSLIFYSDNYLIYDGT